MVQQNQHHKPKQNWNLNDVIIFDSGFKIKVAFMNPDLVTNIKLRKSPLHIYTNEGTKKITRQGNTKKFGDICYDLNQMAKIFGF